MNSTQSLPTLSSSATRSPIFATDCLQNSCFSRTAPMQRPCNACIETRCSLSIPFFFPPEKSLKCVKDVMSVFVNFRYVFTWPAPAPTPSFDISACFLANKFACFATIVFASFP